MALRKKRNEKDQILVRRGTKEWRRSKRRRRRRRRRPLKIGEQCRCIGHYLGRYIRLFRLSLIIIFYTEYNLFIFPKVHKTTEERKEEGKERWKNYFEILANVVLFSCFFKSTVSCHVTWDIHTWWSSIQWTMVIGRAPNTLTRPVCLYHFVRFFCTYAIYLFIYFY